MDLRRETEAIDSIAQTLADLNPEAQNRVLDYIARAFGASLALPSGPPPGPQPATVEPTRPGDRKLALPDEAVDVRSFREEKQPRNQYEMAALVAYYLAELAPATERKTSITGDDVEKYFKQAGYPLPSRTRDALKTAPGYLEKIGRGEFQLTRVGYNLVVHKLPPRNAGS